MKKTLLLISFLFSLLPIYSVSSIEFIGKIRQELPNLSYSSTGGAIDADGNFTKAAEGGLGCSGFVKWMADGFYKPLRVKNGQNPIYMSLVQLRQKHPECRGDRYTNLFEDSRDPYFGLDWTRNIAVELASLQQNESFENEDFDVRDSTIINYTEDRGYNLKYLEKVLLEQAKNHPDRWYLGSISGPFGKNPRLHQHYHVAAFIPYTDTDGETKISVFESCKESSFKELARDYPNTYCHLVWLSMEGEFVLNY